ncbi:hypothetical protein [Xylanimonas sp. McL0601]|uniref:hypothetical protein n=1 Tax=Xylanimonas sp. McL0601 TaxID=3414739 RepID=UPI003CF0E2F2
MIDERPGAAADLPGEAPPDAPAPVTDAPFPAPRRRGVVVVLAVLLVAALGLGGYLWYAADRWHADSDAWQQQAHAQAQRVIELETRLEASTEELSSARDQLATATARITTLADEKAQLGDVNAAAQQYLDYQKRVSEAAGVVAQALGRCTAGQSQLITYLRSPDQYDAADLTRFAKEVDALCKQATDANTKLQQELQQ